MKPLYLITLSCLLLSCGKDKTEPKQEVPQRTTSGANILVCKVNGVLHIYDDEFPTWTSPAGVIYDIKKDEKRGAFVYIYAIDAAYDDLIDISVFDTNSVVNKRYELVEQTDDNIGIDRGIYKLHSDYRYMSRSGYIKFDRLDAEVAAGEFAFTAYMPDGQKVEVTEGYFDMQRYK